MRSNPTATVVAMLFRLVIEKNGKRSKVVELRADSARIGRAHGNEIRIPSADVSRRHCQLRADDGLLRVVDLESVNGTYLNGDLLTGEAVVRPGDRLEVGPITFVVEYEPTPEAVERLQEMDYEVLVEDSLEAVAAEDEEEDEDPPPPPTKRKPRRPPIQEEEVEDAEEVEDQEVVEVEEVVETEDYTPRVDLEDMNWAPSGEGDLHDLLTHLDEGQESLMPRKRPGPRPRQPDSDDWPDDHRSGLEGPPKPKNKGGKRKPKDEDE